VAVSLTRHMKITAADISIISLARPLLAISGGRITAAFTICYVYCHHTRWAIETVILI